MSPVDVLREAIRLRKSVELTYNGEVRTVCPHALGPREQSTYVLVYQVKGPSTTGSYSRGARNNWRCLDAALISEAAIVEDEWRTSNDGQRPHGCMETVECEVGEAPPKGRR